MSDQQHGRRHLFVCRRGWKLPMALLISPGETRANGPDRATQQSPLFGNEVRFWEPSSKLMGRRPVPMLRVVDGGSEAELREHRSEKNLQAEPAIPARGDEAAMRALLRTSGPPRQDPHADPAPP